MSINASHINNPDYEPVVLKKTAPKKGGSTYQISHEAKLEKNEETFQTQKYDSELIKKIVAFRVSKKWTQQQLAANLNMPQKTIQGIEANTIPYNSGYVQKINNYISRAMPKS
jgi:ribosome-binding protein aMBF1 (putative translation factor)